MFELLSEYYNYFEPKNNLGSLNSFLMYYCYNLQFLKLKIN